MAEPAEDSAQNGPKQRLDKWLWYARFVKTRSLATTLAASGKLRLNGQRITKAAQTVKPGDVLTFPLGPYIRVIKVAGAGHRRGPAPEAQLLYEDLDPPQKQRRADSAPNGASVDRPRGAGRPTKKERRETDFLKGKR